MHLVAFYFKKPSLRNSSISKMIFLWGEGEFFKYSKKGNVEKIVDAPGNDGNASMPEQVKRLNPWRKVMMR